jgi:hypothetical protein
MRINPVGWLLFVFFLGGGVWFTAAMPEIWIGQIWIAVSFVMIAGLWLLGRPGAKAEKLRMEGILGQASIVEATQTGTQINRQPVVKLKLRIAAPGVTPFEAEKREIVPLIALGRLTSGSPVTVYVDRADHSRFALDWSSAPGAAGPAPGPATIASADGPQVEFTSNPAAREAVAQVLLQHGINPAGTVDLRQRPEVRKAVADALRNSGVEVPASSAAATDGERDPYARIQKLTELRASGLIGDAEYADQKARILREI